MDFFAQSKQYVLPAFISVVMVSLMKIGIFVTQADLVQSFRQLENAIRLEYATKQDVQDIKTMLNRLDVQISKLDERLNHRRGEP